MPTLLTAYSDTWLLKDTSTTGLQKARIDTMLLLVEGFETPLSMELLATVDCVMANEVADKTNLADVTAKVHQWNERKRELMTPGVY